MAFVLRRQVVHLFFVVVLVSVAWALAAPALGDGSWLGVSGTTWFVACLVNAIVHQTYIWLAWRTQVAWRSFTQAFGDADFAVHVVVFFVLLVLRYVFIVGVSVADAGSLRLPASVATALAVIVAVPSLYTGWCIARYFGFLRASGGDHFRARYREMPLVREGAFGWTPNAMYVFGFLSFWIVPLATRSQAGLVAALFQHAYIWVHYLCTEEPDMAVLYR